MSQKHFVPTMVSGNLRDAVFPIPGGGVEGGHSDWLARVCVDPLMLPEAGGGQGRDGGKGDRK